MSEQAQEDAKSLWDYLSRYEEWFWSEEGETSQHSVRLDEITLIERDKRCLLTLIGERGLTSLRVLSWRWMGSKLELSVVTTCSTEKLVQLVPRTSSLDAFEEIKQARLTYCQKLAQFAARMNRAVVERASFCRSGVAGMPGQYARVVLRKGNARLAVTGMASDQCKVRSFLSSSLLWFFGKSGPKSPQKLQIFLKPEIISDALIILSTLKPAIRRSLEIYSLDSESWEASQAQFLTTDELFSQTIPARSFKKIPVSLEAESIEAQAKEAIDIVRSNRSETLRFRGLPFARIIQWMAKGTVLFGIDKRSRQILTESNSGDFERLISQLREHRRADTTNRSHRLYSARAESWLESILLKDIRQLDPSLVETPVYCQFRTGERMRSGAVDLFALRADKRLVLIELKVTEDRDLLFQGLEYWIRVESLRRAGKIDLFAEISDLPPILYLVAPALRFHNQLRKLAQMVENVEIYSYRINEDWRSGVKVLSRSRLS